MLEPCINQAAGLQSLTSRQGPKLIAVTSHGQQNGELPLLWRLCATWVDMGLSVMVLDGHAQETDDNPGLLQVLNNPMGHLSATQEDISWSVLPAARGFDHIARNGLHAFCVGDLLQNYGVVLIYADADTLSGMLKDSGLAPLVVVAPLKASSLTAYQALKQLLLHAHLHPTVANIVMATNATSNMPHPVQNLQHCAMTFLGLDVRPITVSATATADDSRLEFDRLALQLLENAVFLERQPKLRMH